MKINIKATYALLATGFASTEETRYYLCGFNLRRHKDGGVVICATDGHRMGIFHDPDGILDDQAHDTIWNLPADFLRACVARKSDSAPRRFIIDPSTALSSKLIYQISIARGAEIIATGLSSPINGSFPAYEKVVPKKTEAPVVQSVNYKLLEPFVKVAQTDPTSDYREPSGPGCLWLHASGNNSGPIVVLAKRSDFFGLVMPMYGKKDTAPAGLPRWWKG